MEKVSEVWTRQTYRKKKNGSYGQRVNMRPKSDNFTGENHGTGLGEYPNPVYGRVTTLAITEFLREKKSLLKVGLLSLELVFQCGKSDPGEVSVTT